MLSRVDVTNARGNVLSLSLDEDDGNPYQIADIEGLDPVKAVLVSSSYAGTDGEQSQSVKRGARYLKIKLDLDPDFNPKTYSDLRTDLYSFFMTKAQVSLRFFMTSGLYVDIVGTVEETSAPHFEADPTVEVSITCFEPDFIDGRMITVNAASVDDTTSIPIDYPGTVEAGTVLTIHFNRAVSEFTVYNQVGGRLYQLDFSGALLNGDKLVISSLQGNKGITLTRASVSSSFLYGRSSQSSWIELMGGLNQFRVYAEGDPIPYVLEYVVRYGAL